MQSVSTELSYLETAKASRVRDCRCVATKNLDVRDQLAADKFEPSAERRATATRP